MCWIEMFPSTPCVYFYALAVDGRKSVALDMQDVQYEMLLWLPWLSQASVFLIPESLFWRVSRNKL